MRELVILITDLYLAPERGAATPPAVSVTVPALEHLTRFAHRRVRERDWRVWAARWLGLAGYAALPPASIAAAGRSVPGETVWFASPLHLIAGVGRLHLQRRGLLRLGFAACERLAGDFNSTFAGSGFALAPLEPGEFLLGAPSGLQGDTLEPARMPQGAPAELLPLRSGAAPLRRLGAEIEMWLHAHPLNGERARRGEPPLTHLWIWGGGQAPARGSGQTLRAAVYGADPYLAGLARLGGGAAASEPHHAREALAPQRSALLALEIAELLRRESQRTLGEALEALDAAWIVPALKALRDGSIEQLTLLANDRLWRLARIDRLRRWRRRRRGLGALA